MASRIDWAKIKEKYCTTNLSYRKLQDEFGVSYVTIAKKCKAENWAAERKEVTKEKIKKFEKNAVRKQVNVLSGALETTETCLRYADQLLNCGELNARDLKDVSTAVKNCVGLLRDFYNIPTPGEEAARYIASERLELDKRKAEAETESDNSTIEVVFTGRTEGAAI